MMRDRLKPPFRFDLRGLLDKARHLPIVAEGVTLKLPFVSITVKRDTVLRAAAREIVIRLADKRVLNAFECCDDCIRHALASLQEIRSLLVDKQVDLKDKTDSALYLLVEFMRSAVAQFLTFVEKRDPLRDREDYFAALEMLRAHLYRCVSQVAVIADVEVPRIVSHMRYDLAWDERAYLASPASEGRASDGDE